MMLSDYNHDGYMTRMVSKSIFFCQTLTVEERRADIKKMEVRDARQADDFKLILPIVFSLLKESAGGYYGRDMFPSIDHVRVRIEPVDDSVAHCNEATIIDINTRKKLYAEPAS